MNDFQKPVKSKDPYEKFRSEEIGEKKILEEEEKKENSKNKKEENNFLVNAILFLFKKITDLFSEVKETDLSFSNAIKNFKGNLEKLEKSDVSEDSKYIADLSLSWIIFIKTYEEHFLKQNKHLPQVDLLIKEINEYPTAQEYSLGYYLNQYKEKNWHPYPFMNLLKELRREYETKKNIPIFQKTLFKEKKDFQIEHSMSHLQKWISILNKFD